MDPFRSHLDPIDRQSAQLADTVAAWADINSHSANLPGLAAMAEQLRKHFATLGGQLRLVDLPPHDRVDAAGLPVPTPVGQAIHITKRPTAPLRIFLCIHMDTVYPADSPFQKTQRIDANTLRGPGVADAKGGLLVMFTALQALESSPWANNIGWEIFINPDEEIGSPSSASFLKEAATRNHLGVLFEPALPDGSLASSRKGSGNFTVVVRGKAAHAGRDFAQGKSAVLALAGFVTALDQLNKEPGVTANTGSVTGGGPANVVPDLAIARFNLRVTEPAQMESATRRLAEIVETLNRRDGITAQLHGRFLSPPKVVDAPTQGLLEAVADCGNRLGLSIHWQPTGGVSDGNKLAAFGLPNVDTLGVRGGDIHSPREYLFVDSLAERAKLTALLLMRLASGELPWPTSHSSNHAQPSHASRNP